MNNYLVTHEAVIGRSIDNENTHPTVRLTFYTLHEGINTEDVQTQVVQYSDPVFKTKIINIAEIGDLVSLDELKSLLSTKTVINEQ